MAEHMTAADAKALLDRIRAEQPQALLAASNTIAIDAIAQCGELSARLDDVTGKVDKVAMAFAAIIRAQQEAGQEPAGEVPSAPAAPSVPPAPSIPPAPTAPKAKGVAKGRSGPPGTPSPAAPTGTAPPIVQPPPEGSEPTQSEGKAS